MPYPKFIPKYMKQTFTLVFILEYILFVFSILEIITLLIEIDIAPLTVLFCNFPLFCNCPLADL